MNKKGSYYNSIVNIKNKEEGIFSNLQKTFQKTMRLDNNNGNTMINEYISAQGKRRECREGCDSIRKDTPKGCTSPKDYIYMNTRNGKSWSYKPGKSIGHKQIFWNCKSSCKKMGGRGNAVGFNWCICKKCKETPSTLAGSLGLSAKINSAGTEATPDEALTDTVNSCKAGCDLEWSGIFNVDKGEDVGKYYSSNNKEDNINTCTDLSKYAPKVKLGGKCDSNEECETDVCVTSGGKCETYSGEKNIIKGRCGLGGVRVDGGNWAWGSTWISLCKQDADRLGITRWPGAEQYLKYSGHWIRIQDFGWPHLAAEIPNQRLESGKYIQDLQTALKAANAYGERCKGFIKTDEGYILQDSGNGVAKPSWQEMKSELGLLNNTSIREGFTADADKNRRKAKNQSSAVTSGEFYDIPGVGGQAVREVNYANPTFPIAKVKTAMGKTCPKSWRNRDSGTCAIYNDDVKERGSNQKYGWNGSSYGCNKADTNHYRTDCADVPDKTYTCWQGAGSKISRGVNPCKNIKGRDIAQCFREGGRPRDPNEGSTCPVPSQIMVYVDKGRYNYNRDNIIPALQEIASVFPDVRIMDKNEMDNTVAKGVAICACGWYRKDVFSGTTWKTANNSRNGPGLEKLPLANGYPSVSGTSGGCGGGRNGIINCSQRPTAWNRGKGGIYITFTGTKEFSIQQLRGLGFSARMVESPATVREKVPSKMTWALGSRKMGKWGHNIYSAEKPLDTRTTKWTNVPGKLSQLSTGKEEVYGVNAGDNIYAHSKYPDGKNALNRRGWRRIPGGLKNVSATNNKWIFGANRGDNIYQCKKPCEGAWQRISGGLKQVSGGQNYLYGVNRGDYIYRRRLDSRGALGSSWYNIPGRLKWVNASNKNYVYGANSNDNIYVCKKPCSGGWRQISGGLKNIAADADNVYGTNSGNAAYKKPMDGMKASGNWNQFLWRATPGGSGSKQISPEPFVGGIKEGYTPLENNMINSCKKSKVISNQAGINLGRTGDYLPQFRKYQKTIAAQLERNASSTVNAISRMQGEHLKLSPEAMATNQNLISKLASYQQAKAELLKDKGGLATLEGVLEDKRLKKNSNDIMYYVWLTLAISILFTVVRKIR